MASSIPLFSKVVNSFLFRKVQNDPLVQTIKSVFKKSKVTSSTESHSNTPNQGQENLVKSPKASPKSKFLFFFSKIGFFL